MSEQDTGKSIEGYLASLDEELPPSIAGKLRAARYDALAIVHNPRKGRVVPAIVFASVACIACISFIAITNTAPDLPMQNVQSETIADIGEFTTDDMALLSDGEELELLENIDFILWLSELDDAGLG